MCLAPERQERSFQGSESPTLIEDSVASMQEGFNPQLPYLRVSPSPRLRVSFDECEGIEGVLQD
jgi:hypothetical protein